MTAQRDIVIMPPTYSDTGRQESEIVYQLQAWAKRDGRGLVFGSSTGFTLPNGAIRSPDASWIPRDKWNALNRHQREESFAPICPDFVVELRSRRGDTLPQLKTKMSEYVANGAQLGFLIDPLERQVHVYRPGRSPRLLDSPVTVSGGSLLPGFTLRLSDIWG
jgi:Uma2 family endonuclease